jgi:hypothetical protein
MFARSTFGNQFQPFAFGASPFTAGVGYGGLTPFAPQFSGYNPLLQFLMPQFPPIGAFSGYNPGHPQIGNYGFNPYQATQTPGLTPPINPLVAAQLAGINPTVLPQLLPQILAAASGQQWGQVSPFGQQVNPGQLFQPMGIETSYFGQSPFAQSLTGGLPTQTPNYTQFSPFAAQDPVTATLLAQQLNPLAQQRLPIRPLTGQQQVDPYQIGLSGITGLMGNQSVDPYSTLAQAQLLAQCAVNPIQQMGRTYSLGNWAGSPYSMGQTSPVNQLGQLGQMGHTAVPFNF